MSHFCGISLLAHNVSTAKINRSASCALRLSKSHSSQFYHHSCMRNICRKRCFFVDLFVRVSNQVAVEMYTKLGYNIYRRVIEYYSGEKDEDAFGQCLEVLRVFSCHISRTVFAILSSMDAPAVSRIKFFLLVFQQLQNCWFVLLVFEDVGVPSKNGTKFPTLCSCRHAESAVQGREQEICYSSQGPGATRRARMTMTLVDIYLCHSCFCDVHQLVVDPKLFRSKIAIRNISFA